MIKIRFIFWFMLFGVSIWAQTWQQSLDSTRMWIGDQQNLTLRSKEKPSDESLFAGLDTISWFEFVDKGEWVQDADRFFIRKIRFTVFDSGVYQLPDLSLHSGSNPLYLQVSLAPDSTKVFKPIKNIEETASKPAYLLFLLVGLAVIILSLILLWFFFHTDTSNKAAAVYETRKEPWQVALEELQVLDQKKLWQQNQLKQYYDELNFIARRFISSGLHIHAMEMTSSEILDALSLAEIKIEANETLKNNFQVTDLVKFAQHIPEPEENQAAMQNIRQFIEQNRSGSKILQEKYAQSWKNYLGMELSAQFENPDELVQEEILSLRMNPQIDRIVLIKNWVHLHEFSLPQHLVEWHWNHMGMLSRWHNQIMREASQNKIYYVLFFIAIPVIAIFLPLIWVVTLFQKQNLTGKGRFKLSPGNKLLCTYQLKSV
ncbi:MAG: hypothetical protein IPQ10_08345 [Saprospiraceae bacterium]|nr:hypothetical protein [Saprospiraceae bacterium]MBK7795947.1 hypothetical protein [Saprospiraceae bacterium]MBL0261060.1 hypothetical protein [Saprospiraceae bacterium]